MMQMTDREVKTNDLYAEQFEHFEQDGAARSPSWLYPLRKAGFARFAENGFPTLQDEDWRYTNLQGLAALPFKPVFVPTSSAPKAKALRYLAFANLPGPKLVFVNGHFNAELSVMPPAVKGLRVGSVAGFLQTEPDLIQPHLARFPSEIEDVFAALNTAFFQDGAFIHVARGVTLDDPIQLLFFNTGLELGASVQPRNIILADEGSSVNVVESFVGDVENAYFTNSVTQFVLKDGARVEHCKFQDEQLSAYHIAGLYSDLGAQANFRSHSFATGARLSRNNIRTRLGGAGVECTLNGLYLTKGEQLADHHMIVDHAQPHCASHEYFNGILDGRSRGVFHGRILVRPGAQKTDAKQTNKNLLLSDDATANTKPQLEIYADDVKCTHGATIGQLNEESIFYLRARGIGLEAARRMLIHAFAGEIIDRIGCPSVREELDEIIWERLEQTVQVQVPA